MKRSIYLDHAAATPLDPQIQKAMEPYYSEKFYNPSASYTFATQAKKELQVALSTIAQNLGIKSTEIVMTSGGSEANNLAIAGVMQKYPDKKILVSAVEHESVLAPASQFNCQKIPVDKQGRINLKSLDKLIDDDVALVSVMQANNEVGTIQPIRDIALKIENIKRNRQKRGNKIPLYLHTDSCQAPLYLDVHPNRLGVDLMTLNGGKIYGPKQSGMLFVKSGVKVFSQIKGGGQQRGLRSGTESPAQVVGFAMALDKAIQQRKAENQRTHSLQKKFIEGLLKISPKIAVNGPSKKRLPNNIHITIVGEDNERLIYQLDGLGIMVAAGSACSASNDEPSSVLKAMGLSDDDARSSLRMTMGRATTEDDISNVLKTLKQLLA